ncbi:general secretion pathway protein GspK [Candidatus Sumerlaeota bacterium]|nr:general secretion pathway protein GspK [Candidatus Sumerlaeota bacterium]
MTGNIKNPIPRRRRGVILILTLWIAIILSMMAFSIAHELQLNLRLAKFGQDRAVARALARAGLAKAVVDLRNDRLLMVADPTQWSGDTLHDIWSEPEDKTDVKLGDGTYSVQITDEESKININYLTAINAPALGYIIQKLTDMDPYDANNVAYMIADWKDPDINPASGGGATEEETWTEFGLKNFSDTLPANWFYKPKNDMFFNLDELLEIPGITRELLYGPRDEKEKARDPRHRRRKRKEGDESHALADYITVRSAGYININTAPKFVLEAIFSTALGGGGAAEGWAQKVIETRERKSPSRETSTNILNAFQQLQEAGIPPNEVQRMNQIFNLNNVSTYFTILSQGSYHGTEKTLKALVNVKLEAFNKSPDEKHNLGHRDKNSRGRLRTQTDHIIDSAVRVDDYLEM